LRTATDFPCGGPMFDKIFYTHLLVFIMRQLFSVISTVSLASMTLENPDMES